MPRTKRKASDRHPVLSHEPPPAAIAHGVARALSTELVARVSAAGEALFAAAPWRCVPTGEALLGLTLVRYGVRDWVVTILGAKGLEPGVLLFRSIDDFEAYMRAGRAGGAGLPSFLAFHYISDPLRLGPGGGGGGGRGQTLRSAALTPAVHAFGGGRVPAIPEEDEIEVVLATVQALATPRDWTGIFAHAERVGSGWHEKISVPGRDGPNELYLVAPFDRLERALEVAGSHDRTRESLAADVEREPSRGESPSTDEVAALREAFVALEHTDVEIDEQEARPLEDRLIEMFLAAPEGELVEDVGSANWVLEFGRGFFGVTVFSLDPLQLEEIVFEILPRKVMLDPRDAAAVIEELRAFYRYLDRVFELPQAAECLGSIGPGAEEELEGALGDTEGFGVGKQILAAGAAAGFDIGTPEGLVAWMDHVREHGLPADVRLPGESAALPATGLSRAAKQRAKSKRKSAAAARRKNRPRR